jgi:hypothetical protein
MENPPQDQLCRRSGRREPLPIELKLVTSNGDVTAIIRDASLEAKEESGFVAIGILHNEPLPMHETLRCRIGPGRCVSEVQDGQVRRSVSFYHQRSEPTCG